MKAPEQTSPPTATDQAQVKNPAFTITSRRNETIIIGVDNHPLLMGVERAQPPVSMWPCRQGTQIKTGVLRRSQGKWIWVGNKTCALEKASLRRRTNNRPSLLLPRKSGILGGKLIIVNYSDTCYSESWIYYLSLVNITFSFHFHGRQTCY